jgi:hypothetical protein
MREILARESQQRSEWHFTRMRGGLGPRTMENFLRQRGTGGTRERGGAGHTWNAGWGAWGCSRVVHGMGWFGGWPAG